MWIIVVRRIGIGLVLMWVVSLLIFAMTQVLPGDAILENLRFLIAARYFSMVDANESDGFF